MKVFVLHHLDFEYDQVEDVAVAAEDESTARKLASEAIDAEWDNSGPEWLDPQKVSAKEITLEEAGVFLIAIHYG